MKELRTSKGFLCCQFLTHEQSPCETLFHEVYSLTNQSLFSMYLYVVFNLLTISKMKNCYIHKG